MKNKFYAVLEELTQKVPLNEENATGGVVAPERWEKSRNLNAMANYMNVLHELRMKKPQIGPSGKGEKKTKEEIDNQGQLKLKANHFNMMAELGDKVIFFLK